VALGVGDEPVLVLVADVGALAVGRRLGRQRVGGQRGEDLRNQPQRVDELAAVGEFDQDDDPTAVMYPYYRMVTTLAAPDKAAILTLYAAQTSSVTLTEGGALIVIVAVADLPSDVAVTVALPIEAATTSPAAFTVATELLLDDHAMVRSLSVTPVTSFSVALSCCDSPTRMDSVEALSTTAATARLPTMTVFVSDAGWVPGEPVAVPVTLALPS